MSSPILNRGDAIVWHTLGSNDVLKLLHASANGLSPTQVEEIRERVGYNELPSPKKDSPLLLFARQFFSLLMIVLMIAAIVSGAMGEMVEAIAIVVIVILAAVVGFIQEYKAEQALEALQRLAVPKAAVLRDGLESLIPARELVPGDIIVLKTGDAIPADGRLLGSMNLTIDESMLTGESRPSLKDANALPEGNSQPGDRVNMVYGGTMIQYGRGTAVVTGTGLDSEMGKIASLLQATTQRRTPLQDNLDALGRNLGFFSIALAAVMSFLGVLRGYPIGEMFVWGVAIAVAVIPEALPAVMTITLALGVRRMAERKAIIRKLPAVETLGATSVICSDKTGTLTQNEMTVRQIVTGSRVIEVSGTGFEPKGQFLVNGVVIGASDPELHDLLRVALLCNDAVLQWSEEKKEWQILGDPTEGALLVAAKKGGLDLHSVRQRYLRTSEIPFSSERKRMTTIHQDDQGILVCSKGAPEMLLDSCAEVYTNDGLQALEEGIRNRILERGLELAGRGLRVLAFASAHHPAGFKGEPECGLVFLGMMAMQDPVRPEVLGAIKTCELAGIRPVMITGDHRLTAMSIGDELGIRKRGGIITGQELAEMSDEELERRVEMTDIFARIAPEHKLRIVNAFMNKGSVVAMTGDGVNDAPALKRADIGVAMGITGTDVSKEASDMILTDDNFATIVDAIEEGRSIFVNIKKYLVFLLSGNMGTVLALIIALLLGMQLPLQAVHVLFINFIMDGLIAISLGLDPPERGIMRRAPRPVKEGILNTRTYVYIGVLGTIIGMATFLTYKVAGERWAYGHPEATTLFFVSLIAARLANAFNCRSFVGSAFNWKQKRNNALLGGIMLTVILTSFVVFVPAMHHPFQTTALGWRDLAAAGVVALIVLASGELVKVVARLKKPKTV